MVTGSAMLEPAAPGRAAHTLRATSRAGAPGRDGDRWRVTTRSPLRTDPDRAGRVVRNPLRGRATPVADAW